MDRSKVAVIVPAFNEAQSIAGVISELLPHGIVIAIDDASTDGTYSTALESGAVVVKHPYNQGYDAALNSGFSKAADLGCDYAITFDADGQHDASLIPKFIDLFSHGVDMVIGVRPQPARLGEYLFSLYTRWKFGVRDPLCGMKGYRMSIYQARGWFDSYQSIGTELMLFGLRKQYTYEQIEVPIAARQGSGPRFGNRIKANWRILRAITMSLWHYPAG